MRASSPPRKPSWSRARTSRNSEPPCLAVSERWWLPSQAGGGAGLDGLLLVRERRMPEAVAALEKAAALAPDNPHYAFVYAIALDSTGKPAKALAVLAEAQRRFPGDREILDGLVDISRRVGDDAAAARWGTLRAQLDRE